MSEKENDFGCTTLLVLFAALYFLLTGFTKGETWNLVLGVLFSIHLFVVIKLPRFRARTASVASAAVAAYYLVLALDSGVTVIRTAWIAFFAWFAVQQWKKGIGSPFAFDEFEAPETSTGRRSQSTPPPLPGQSISIKEPVPLQPIKPQQPNTPTTPVNPPNNGFLAQEWSPTILSQLAMLVDETSEVHFNVPLLEDQAPNNAVVSIHAPDDTTLIFVQEKVWNEASLQAWAQLATSARSHAQYASAKLLVLSPERVPTTHTQPHKWLAC